MKYGYLSQYFDGVSTKTLTLVDAQKLETGRRGSNQHEIGGPASQLKRFTQFLGTKSRKMSNGNGFPTRYIYIDGENDTFSVEGHCSWYDVRENNPKRSAEWRLYYQPNTVTETMEPGDKLYLAKLKADYVLFIVVAKSSDIVTQLRYLFGLTEESESGFAVQDFAENNPEIDFLTRLVLEEIGIEYEDPNANTLDTIIDRFGLSFPTTREFSDLARQTLPELDPLDDPDHVLMAWLDHEFAMFSRLEARIVTGRLEEGWMDENRVADVDGFLKFSLSVQNRRKSRMGHSFENQLSAMFDAHNVRYDAQKKTEKGKKPDYIFPGIHEYFDCGFNTSFLTMLGAKSTCKERWSQVLPEAERLEWKHLATLEQGIAESTTDQMQASKVQLVVPEKIRTRFYSESQQTFLLNISGFLDLVKHRQASAAR